MLDIYQKYIFKNFLERYFLISLIFFTLTIILNILEEISFFKGININPLYPYFLSFLNAPIMLFEIFPFIILLSTQFLYFDLFQKDELNLLKKSGLSNLKIIKIIFLTSLIIGIFNVFIFYNVASFFKFHYSNIKNNFSNDNKYLAMVLDSGLWIKDQTDNEIFIIKSSQIKNDYLIDTKIYKFNKNFELLDIIQSKEINIKNLEWLIYNPIITSNNLSKEIESVIKLKTNFNENMINNYFSNISTHGLIKLFSIKKNFENLGYSTSEIQNFILQLLTTPLLYGILTLLSSIIMLNFVKNRTLLFNVVLGISLSVIIYYIRFIFSSLGNSGVIPLSLSVFFPMIVILLLTIIGLITINEK
jgi:lipopolysaccharide export system permease protein